MPELQVGDGVIIDGSKLGMNGGLLTGIVKHIAMGEPSVLVYFPREVERGMLDLTAYRSFIYPHEITATIPNCGHWLGKEIP